MKYHYSYIISLYIILLLCSCNVDKSIELYVSLNGNENALGTKNDPFADIESVKEYVRQLREKGDSTHVSVYFREGTYKLDKTFILTPEFSNMSFSSYNDESVVITGGDVIKGWKKLDSERPEITEEAKGNIWEADIPKGWKFHYMYVNGEMAERSKSDHRFWREWNKDHSFGDPLPNGQMVYFKNKEQLKYLPNNGDLEMLCILMQYGVQGNGVMRDIDIENGSARWTSKQLYLTYRISRDPYERGYRFENALCLIDRPGEWAVDSENGKVYYWPVDGVDMRNVNIVAPKLYELVRLQGNEENGRLVRNVSFKNLTFIYTDRLPEDKWPENWMTRQWENPDATIYMTGVEGCNITNCRILHSGSYGITLNHYAQNNTVEQCEIGWTGSGGIFLEGYGPGTLNVNKNNVVCRNYIHDHGLGNYWHCTNVQLYQSGHNYIAYNILANSAYSGISMIGAAYQDVNNPKYFFPEYKVGEYLWWKQYCIRYQDFPKDIQNGIRNETFKFDRETIKPYLHTSNNLVEYNIITEPHLKLFEGGAIYAYSVGKWNKWLNNVIFKSTGMPGSSIFALDNIVEFTTVKGNVYWINGPILCGVGARSDERGNDISGNVRVNCREEFKEQMPHGYGLWYRNDTGRESLDSLVNVIKLKVDSMGGWPKGYVIDIPSSENGLPKLEEQYEFPKGAHFTIE